MGDIVPALQVNPNSYKSILFMGAPGTGKTTAALKMFPGLKKLVVDVDDKAIMALNAIPEPLRSKLAEKTDIWQPTNKRLSGSQTIGIIRQERYDAQKKLIPGTEGFVPPDPKGYREIVDFFNDLGAKQPFPYGVVVVDTYTVIGEHLAAMILNHHRLSGFTLPLYGIYKQNMLELTKGILALPCHRIICVHEVTREKEDTDEVFIRPSIMGSYRDEMVKEFSEAYRFLGRTPTEYMIRTVANARVQARTAMPLKAECNVDEMLKAFA